MKNIVYKILLFHSVDNLKTDTLSTVIRLYLSINMCNELSQNFSLMGQLSQKLWVREIMSKYPRQTNSISMEIFIKIENDTKDVSFKN